MDSDAKRHFVRTAQGGGEYEQFALSMETNRVDQGNGIDCYRERLVLFFKLRLR